jgi:Ser/Thr protein kinase RdoA (MazF antagonist)
MTDVAVVGRILREYHLRGAAPEGIRRLSGSVRGTQVSYLVSHDGPPLVIRAYRADAPVPVQFSGSAAETMAHWVTGRAGTLACLAEAGYPAPRPVPSRTGELVGVAGPWLTWATSYLEGPALLPSLDQLRLLGRALGLLHAQSFDITGWRQGQPSSPAGPAAGQRESAAGAPAGFAGPASAGAGPDGSDTGETGHGEAGSGAAAESAESAGAGPAGAGFGGAAERAGAGPAGRAAAAAVPGLAAWHPAAAVAGTLRRLRAVAPLLPADWRDMHAAFLATAEAVQLSAPELPEALVHGDAWPGNAVQPQAGPVMLIDWDTAGLGLPVLDLGNCLAECHLNSNLPPDQPQAWLVRPDAHRIAAVASGYREVRELTAAERELLPEAVRFGAAFVGAIHCEAALTGGASGPGMDTRLARLRNRLEVSPEVARLALRHL